MSEPGLLAGRYTLVRRIGAGAMGTVWLAHDETLHREVAVKQITDLPRSDRDAEVARLRAMREGRLVARLNHPNVVGIYDVVMQDEHPWLVMEYVRSRTLTEAVRADGPLAPGQAAAVGAQLADALAEAHRVGVVHRDVKPGNVLLTDTGRAKITDFGIARAGGGDTLTEAGLLAGTPAYFAPELARGATATPGSDVWSLGATLYYAVEGQPPFGTDGNPLVLLGRVASREVPPPRRAGPLAPVLLRLLSREPADRPTMAEAHTLLAAVPVTAPRVPLPAPPDSAPTPTLHLPLPAPPDRAPWAPAPTPGPAEVDEIPASGSAEVVDLPAADRPVEATPTPDRAATDVPVFEQAATDVPTPAVTDEPDEGPAVVEVRPTSSDEVAVPAGTDEATAGVPAPVGKAEVRPVSTADPVTDGAPDGTATGVESDARLAELAAWAERPAWLARPAWEPTTPAAPTPQPTKPAAAKSPATATTEPAEPAKSAAPTKPAASVPVSPAALAAATTLPPPPSRPAAPPARTRRTAWVVAAAVAVVALVGGLGWLLLSGDPGPVGGQAAPAPTATRTPSSAPTTQPTTAPTTNPATTPPASTRAASPLQPATMTRFVADYYGLLPGNTAAGWRRLGPGLAGAGYDSYARFWGTIRSVGTSGLVADPGGRAVTGTVVFVTKEGRTSTERHRLALTLTPDGSGLLIDRDTLLG
jgi:serine/threonine protein kinase